MQASTFWADRAAADRGLAPYFRAAAAEGGGGDGDNKDEAEAMGWPEALSEVAEATPAVALAAFGGCTHYLKRLLLDVQLLTMGHVTLWSPTDGEASAGGGSSLVLDAKALENLEVFENSHDHSSSGTLFAILDKCASPFGKRQLRTWLCAPPSDLAQIAERQDAVGALMANAELRGDLAKALRKLPDLERLLARVHAFSVAQSSNNATHYTDIGRARLSELIKTLEGFEHLQKAVHAAADELPELQSTAPQLADTLTVGKGFPELDGLLRDFREAFDWAQAKAEGRVIPSRGVDGAYDEAKEAVDSAMGAIEDVRKEWQQTLGDKRIELWSAAGSPTEPFQLAVPEETLKKKGTPREFTQMSSKKGTQRFYTPPLKEAVGEYPNPHHDRNHDHIPHPHPNPRPNPQVSTSRPRSSWMRRSPPPPAASTAASRRTLASGTEPSPPPRNSIASSPSPRSRPPRACAGRSSSIVSRQRRSCRLRAASTSVCRRPSEAPTASRTTSSLASPRPVVATAMGPTRSSSTRRRRRGRRRHGCCS